MPFIEQDTSVVCSFKVFAKLGDMKLDCAPLSKMAVQYWEVLLKSLSLTLASASQIESPVGGAVGFVLVVS